MSMALTLIQSLAQVPHVSLRLELDMLEGSQGHSAILLAQFAAEIKINHPWLNARCSFGDIISL